MDSPWTVRPTRCRLACLQKRVRSHNVCRHSIRLLTKFLVHLGDESRETAQLLTREWKYEGLKIVRSKPGVIANAVRGHLHAEVICERLPHHGQQVAVEGRITR